MNCSIAVSVVIPTYNGKDLLRQNLPNVVEVLSGSGLMYEIIVVDDASTDDSIEFLNENYAEIRTFRNEINSGFSRTMNRGISEAKHDWILSLNNDMRLPGDFFSPIVSLLNDNVFSVSCTIKDGKGERILESAKVLKRGVSSIRSKDAEYDVPVYSLYSCGGCALYNRVKLLELGGFDEIFSPFYYEDMDLGLKAWHRGWSNMYTPGTFCYHDHSVTIKTKFKRYFVKKTINRNKLILQYIYLENPGFILFICQLMLKFLYSGLLAFTPKRRAFVQSVFDLISISKNLNIRRKREKKAIVLSLNEIMQNIGKPVNI